MLDPIIGDYSVQSVAFAARWQRAPTGHSQHLFKESVTVKQSVRIMDRSYPGKKISKAE